MHNQKSTPLGNSQIVMVQQKDVDVDQLSFEVKLSLDIYIGR